MHLAMCRSYGAWPDFLGRHHYRHGAPNGACAEVIFKVYDRRDRCCGDDATSNKETTISRKIGSDHPHSAGLRKKRSNRNGKNTRCLSLAISLFSRQDAQAPATM